MKRILSSLACVAIAALVGVGAASAASKHVRHHATTQHVAAVAVSQSADGGSCLANSALCGPNCPIGPCSASASAVTASAAGPAKAAFAANAKACGVSDPSQCPASCRRASPSNAVAAKVASR